MFVRAWAYECVISEQSGQNAIKFNICKNGMTITEIDTNTTTTTTAARGKASNAGTFVGVRVRADNVCARLPFRTCVHNNLDNLATLTIQYNAILFQSHQFFSNFVWWDEWNKTIKKAMQRRIDAKNLIPSSPALERGWNSLWVSFIYWLMVSSSLLASVMLCDSLRVDNLIWCVVACFLCVRSFFSVLPCTHKSR